MKSHKRLFPHITALAVVLICLFLLPMKAQAASESDLMFSMAADGKSFCVFSCNASASSDLEIPATYCGMPVTGIDDEAFYNCSSLTSITIPDSVTSIGSYAFSGCTSLTGITIPDSVTTVGDYAFYNCSKLVNVTISNRVTDIGNSAFKNCPELTDITIPDSVTSIGSYAFSGCTGLTGITISDSVASIGEHAFSGCDGITDVYITDPNAWCKINFGNYDSNPLYHTYYGHVLDKDGNEITELVLDSSVTQIPYCAFTNCVNLTCVILPNSVTRIDDSAFWGCAGLTDIAIPDSVTNIEADAFYGCESLTDVYITDPNAWCKINFGNYASNPLYYSYYGHILDEDGYEITELVLDSSVTEIPFAAFANCENLTSVVIPNSITYIDDSAFYYCTGLTELTIPDSITHVGENAFYECTSLTHVYITDPDAWCKIDFGNYDSNPLYHSYYGYILDEDGYEITELVLDSSVTEIPFCAFANCENLTSVVIPNSVTHIDDSAFFCCAGLTELTIPDSVTSIGAYAFSKCISLEYVILPKCVAEIYSNTFQNCSQLKTVFYGGTQEQLTIHIDEDSLPLPDASWHYQVREDVFAGQNCYYCGSCNNYHDIAGNNIPATVVFKNWDGTVLSTKTYHYGDKVTVPSTPSKKADNTYSYSFAGWDKAVVDCAGNATYTATYTPKYIDYTVVFNNWDGTVISTKTYHYGDKVTVPSTPSKKADNTYSYSFAGWDKAVVDCAGNATYTATFTSKYIDYTVVFKNWDGTVLSSKTYHYGDKVTVPSTPSKKADNTYTYSFAGWDKAVVVCAGNTTYTATFTSKYIDYTVVFKNWDGTVLSTKTYRYGNRVTAPASPTKKADNTYTYSFTGWDKTVVSCAENATYTATFTSKYIDYTVVFKNWDGTVLSTKTYHYGDKVSAPDTPSRPNDDKNAYTFKVWDKAVVKCAGNATYTAVYEAKSLVPTTITSSKHTVSGSTISNIAIGTTVDALVKNLNESSYVKVYQGNKEVTKDALIGTGMTVKIMDGSKVTATATVVVTGDTNGDGKLTVTDMLAAKAHLLKKNTLKGAATQAADTNGDGGISITDFIQMKAHVLGKTLVEPKSTATVVPTSVAPDEPEAERPPVVIMTLCYIQPDAMIPEKKPIVCL